MNVHFRFTRGAQRLVFPGAVINYDRNRRVYVHALSVTPDNDDRLCGAASSPPAADEIHSPVSPAKLPFTSPRINSG